jgi:LDH2 family malate/lactate/ureidoglycolate dehydrogenase
VLDISTTTVAANKVKVYDLNGKPVPEGWVVDEAGRPITDAAAAMDIIFNRPGGGLTPLGDGETTGGHKGYGLGMMVQILSATLTGAAFGPVRNRTQRADQPDDIGHFFLAIDPKAYREPDEFRSDLDTLLDELRATPPADPARPVLVAGDPEAEERARRLRDGIPVPLPSPGTSRRSAGAAARPSCCARRDLTGGRHAARPAGSRRTTDERVRSGLLPAGAAAGVPPRWPPPRQGA